MDIEEIKREDAKLHILKNTVLIIFIIVVIWISLVLIEYYRVKKLQKPLICINETKDIEDYDEYSITCYGILYKYREYYFTKDDVLSAQEFTLIFKDFERKEN